MVFGIKICIKYDILKCLKDHNRLLLEIKYIYLTPMTFKIIIAFMQMY